MRVVLDTNILVSGLLWSGGPRAILDAARRGEIQMFTAQMLLDELAHVLKRDKFATRLIQAGVNSDTLIAGIKALAKLIGPQAILPTVLNIPRCASSLTWLCAETHGVVRPEYIQMRHHTDQDRCTRFPCRSAAAFITPSSEDRPQLHPASSPAHHQD
jgi:putative PIN family toxin of toxin-antitoxin system